MFVHVPASAKAIIPQLRWAQLNCLRLQQQYKTTLEKGCQDGKKLAMKQTIPCKILIYNYGSVHSITLTWWCLYDVDCKLWNSHGHSCTKPTTKLVSWFLSTCQWSTWILHQIRQNLCVSKVHTNSGKQTIVRLFSGPISLLILKISVNIFNFLKHLKLYLLSEQHSENK